MNTITRDKRLFSKSLSRFLQRSKMYKYWTGRKVLQVLEVGFDLQVTFFKALVWTHRHLVLVLDWGSLIQTSEDSTTL